MEFSATELADVVIIDPVVFEDDRGFLMETWQKRTFLDAGIDATFVQDVHSRSSRGTVRGLHYQVRQAQGKLIRVLRGELFDVAVDLRRSSQTFGRWVSAELSAANRRQIWIPPGFAHGFMVMSDIADIEYRMTDYYAPEHERTIRWDDPGIGIDWPVAAGPGVNLSDKDLAGSSLNEADVYA